jgi:glutamate-5-semialdehyde dehydrogenase
LQRDLGSWTRPNGLKFTRKAVPIGVIGVIFESRPNVVADAASLCLKAGNASILRCGSESINSSMAIMKAMQDGLVAANIDANATQLIPTKDREAVGIMLKMNHSIDIIIPRGGKSLVKRIMDESSVPTLLHLDGLCHTYIHKSADFAMAKEVVLNAKMRRTGICGATETLLIDEEVAEEFLPEIIAALIDKGCEVRGDRIVQNLDERVIPASEADWRTEYLDSIISIKVVAGADEAIEHISEYGSAHTDAIIAEDLAVVEEFFARIDSAIVMHNASTQFADGGEFGMGAEIGIATGKLHARGPVGCEQLTTYKYIVQGRGQVRP